MPDRADSDTPRVKAKTRAGQIKDAAGDDDFDPEMPDPGAAAYLLAHLWSIGPTMGDAAISDVDLRHYQENMGIVLSPWECRTIRRLSVDCLSESHKASKPDCPPPFSESTDAARLRNAEHEREIDAFLS